MAAKVYPWLYNLNGVTEPLIMPGLFQAGTTATIERGALLEFDGTNWTELNADQAMNSQIAFANQAIVSGDRAGFYEIIVPRPEDVFQLDLATAGNPLIGAAVYWISKFTVAESGSNILGNVVGFDHYPGIMGQVTEGNITNPGVTVRDITALQIVIKEAASYYSLFQTG